MTASIPLPANYRDSFPERGPWMSPANPPAPDTSEDIEVLHVDGHWMPALWNGSKFFGFDVFNEKVIGWRFFRTAQMTSESRKPRGEGERDFGDWHSGD